MFLVGTYNDARWFGWYECSEGVHVTEDGIPFILSEDKDAHDDDDFTSMVEEKMKEALTFSDDDDEYSFTVYKQDDCDCEARARSRIATPLFSRAALQIPRATDTWHYTKKAEGDRRSRYAFARACGTTINCACARVVLAQIRAFPCLSRPRDPLTFCARPAHARRPSSASPPRSASRAPACESPSGHHRAPRRASSPPDGALHLALQPR